MHQPTYRIAHTTAFVAPVVEHWLEREIALKRGEECLHHYNEGERRLLMSRDRNLEKTFMGRCLANQLLVCSGQPLTKGEYAQRAGYSKRKKRKYNSQVQHVCMYIVRTYISTCVCRYIRMHACMHAYTFLSIYENMKICMYVCIYV